MINFDIKVIFGALAELLSFATIGWMFLGVVIGIVFGAVPGLTATTGIALFTPVTFGLSMPHAFSFLLGLFCGGLYGGSIPAILIKTPGAPGNAATTLDGYPMAQNGRAGEALFHSVFSSWIGGTFSAFVLFFFAPLIANFALRFGPQEYFAIALFGISCIAALSGKNFIKGIASGVIGMLLGTVGLDPVDGSIRFIFGNVNLMRGIAVVPTLIGLFAVAEVLQKSETIQNDCQNKVNTQVSISFSKLLSYMKQYTKHKLLILKSAIIGTVIGAVPGTGAGTASWISYNEAKRASKGKFEMGTGCVEGIMASETANNAISGGAMIPLLTLGIPGDTATAVLLSALAIQGLTPGPTMLTKNFGVVSMILWILIISNLFMLLLGVFGSKFFPKILSVSPKILSPLILVFCITGSYAVANSYFDIKVALVIGVLGYLMIKDNFPTTPMVLGLILGPIVEPNFRGALIANKMNPLIFVKSPISCIFIILSVVVFITTMRQSIKLRKKDEAEEAAKAEQAGN